MEDKVSYLIVLFYHIQVMTAFTVFWDLRTRNNGCHREDALLEWVESLLTLSPSCCCCRSLQLKPETCLQVNISAELKKTAAKLTCFRNLLNRLKCEDQYTKVRLFPLLSAVCSPQKMFRSRSSTISRTAGPTPPWHAVWGRSTIEMSAKL